MQAVLLRGATLFFAFLIISASSVMAQTTIGGWAITHDKDVINDYLIRWACTTNGSGDKLCFKGSSENTSILEIRIDIADNARNIGANSKFILRADEEKRHDFPGSVQVMSFRDAPFLLSQKGDAIFREPDLLKFNSQPRFPILISKPDPNDCVYPRSLHHSETVRSNGMVIKSKLLEEIMWGKRLAVRYWDEFNYYRDITFDVANAEAAVQDALGISDFEMLTLGAPSMKIFKSLSLAPWITKDQRLPLYFQWTVESQQLVLPRLTP